MSEIAGPPARRGPLHREETLNALRGTFRLQVDPVNHRIQYPPREVGAGSLGTDLEWRDVEPIGELLAHTRIHASGSAYVAARVPWPIAAVRVGGQVTVIAHLLSAAAVGERLRLSYRLDEAGRGAVCAVADGTLPGDEGTLSGRFLASVVGRHLRFIGGGAHAPRFAATARAAGAGTIVAEATCARELGGWIIPDDGRDAWPVRTDFG